MDHDKEYDAVMDPLRQIEVICEKLFASNHITIEELTLTSTNNYDKSISLQPHKGVDEFLTNKIKHLIEPSDDLSTGFVRIGKCLQNMLITRNSKHPDVGESILELVDSLDTIIKIQSEMHLRITILEQENRQLEEKSLIIVDRMKFDRHQNDSIHTELLAENHAQTEEIESLTRQLESTKSSLLVLKNASESEIITKLNHEIQKLEKGIMESRETEQRLRRFSSEMEAKYAAASADLSQSEEKILELTAALNESRERCVSVEAVCVQWQEYCKSRDDQSGPDTEELALCRSKVNALEAEGAAAAERLARISEENERVREEVLRAQAAVDALTADLEASLSRNSELEARLAEVEAVREREREGSERASMEEGQGTVAAPRAPPDGSSPIPAAVAVAVSGRDEAGGGDDYQRRVVELESQLEESRAVSEGLRQRLYEAGQRQGQVQPEGPALEELVEANRALSAELDAAKEEAGQGRWRDQTVIEKLQMQVEHLQVELQDSQMTIDNVTDQITSSSDEIMQLETTVVDLRQQVTALQEDNRSQQEVISMLKHAERSREALESERVSALTLAVDELKYEKHILEGRIEDLLTGKEGSREDAGKLAKLESAVEALTYEKQLLEQMLEDSAKIHEDLHQERVSTMQLALEQLQSEKAMLEQALRDAVVASEDKESERISTLKSTVGILQGEKAVLEQMLEDAVSARDASNGEKISELEELVHSLQYEKDTLQYALQDTENRLTEALSNRTESVGNTDVDTDSQLSQMSATINQLYLEKAGLEERLRGMEAAMSGLSEDLQAYREAEEEVTYWRTSVENLQTTVESLQREKFSVQDALNEAELRTSNAQREKMQLEEELRVANNRIEGLRSEVSATNLTLGSLVEQTRRSQTEEEEMIASLQGSLLQLSREKEALESRLREEMQRYRDEEEAESDEVVGLKFTVGDLLREKSLLEDRVSVMDKEMESLSEQVELYQPFESECLYLQQSLDATREEKLRLEQQCYDLQQQLASGLPAGSGGGSGSGADYGQYEELRRQNSELSEQLGKTRVVVATLSEEVERSRTELAQFERLQQLLQSSSREKAELEKQLHGAQMMIRSLNGRLEERGVTGVVQGDSNASELRKELDKCREKLAIAGEEEERLRNELEEAQGLELQLHETLRTSMAQESHLKEQLASKESQLMASQHALTQLQEMHRKGAGASDSEHAELMTAYMRAHEEIRRLQDEVEQLMTDLNTLTSELENRDNALTEVTAAKDIAEAKLAELQRTVRSPDRNRPSSSYSVGSAYSSAAIVVPDLVEPASDVVEHNKDGMNFDAIMDSSTDLSSAPAPPPMPSVAVVVGQDRDREKERMAELSAQVASSLSLSVPSGEIIYIEIGGFEIRIGVWNKDTGSLVTCYICPSIIASTRLGQQADELIINGNLYSEKLVTLYREQRILVGREAFYCAYNHSDPRLRAALEVSYPLTQGHVGDSHGLLFLVRHALECAAEVVGVNDLRESRMILSQKPTLTDEDFRVVADALFGENHVDQVSFVSECCLAVEACGLKSALVLDIGASSSYCVAVYEGIVMQNTLVTAAIGGEHITEYLCNLLESQPSDDISAFLSQLPRRRLQIARQLKEDYGFVATVFDESAALYGRIELDHSRRRLSPSYDRDSRTSSVSPYARGNRSEEIRCGEEFALPDGSAVSVALDCERFYCTEVLFTPAAVESSNNAPGLARLVLECIRAVADSVRSEVCGTLLLTGRTALLPGLAPRLEQELVLHAQRFGIPKIGVLVGEGAEWPPSTAWNGISSRLKSLQSSSKPSLNVNNFLENSKITIEEYHEIGPSVLSRRRIL